jgi:hypothetical protein
MFHDTLFGYSLQISKWTIQAKRRKLESRMARCWDINLSRQLDECLILEELMRDLSLRRAA